MPTGYEYQEYKNWRGVPKPRRCPFCKQAKGEIRKEKQMYQEFARIAERRGSYEEALKAWNGKAM
jgi:hypothetical protein